MYLPEPHLWEEPAWGAYASREDLERTGLERMRLLARQDVLQPPISNLTGMAYEEVGAGLTTCAMPASPWFLAATGGFPGGVLALPADAALGGALVTLLEPGQILTTSELFDRWQRDELPAPPLANFFGLQIVEHGPGTMTWTMPATAWLNNAFGVIYGGAIAVLADSAIGGAIWMTMDRGQVLASLNLHVYFFRPVLADGRAMVGRGTVTRTGRSLRVAGAEVFDADGNLVAMGTGSAKVVADRPASLRTSNSAGS